MQYNCPADQYAVKGPYVAGGTQSTYWPISYAMPGSAGPNSTPDGSTTSGILGYTGGASYPLYQWSAKSTQVSHPVNMIMLAEMRMSTKALGRPGSSMDCPDQQAQSGGFGGAADIARYGSTNNPGPYHGSRWNYLSCDGHVQLMKGSDTVLNGDTSTNSFMWDRNN